jgi:hypothetical protein
MSRRSANFSRFAGTSSSPLVSSGYQDTPSPFSAGNDEQTFPLRPLSRNRLSTAGPLGQTGDGGHAVLGQSRKSRLSDGEPPDHVYDRAVAADESEEQDALLLGSAGVEGAWPYGHRGPLETVEENWQPRMSVSLNWLCPQCILGNGITVMAHNRLPNQQSRLLAQGKDQA